jgi:hypothetical protein
MFSVLFDLCPLYVCACSLVTYSRSVAALVRRWLSSSVHLVGVWVVIVDSSVGVSPLLHEFLPTPCIWCGFKGTWECRPWDPPLAHPCKQFGDFQMFCRGQVWLCLHCSPTHLIIYALYGWSHMVIYCGNAMRVKQCRYV